MFTLPPIGRLTRRLAIAAAVAWAVHAVLYWVARAPLSELPTVRWLALVPDEVISRGQLWRVISYAALDLPNGFDGLWSALALWFFGTPIERREGARGLLWPWAVAAVGGALTLLGLRFASPMYGLAPAMGLSSILTSALLVRWGFLHARERVSFFGLAEMDGRVLAAILCGIGVVNGLASRSPIGLASVGATAAVALVSLVRGRGRGGGRTRRRSGSFSVVEGGRKDPPRWMN